MARGPFELIGQGLHQQINTERSYLHIPFNHTTLYVTLHFNL
jgi:hypothetical protein